MILYDDKQNFLGMSSQTLSFLGYEDIGDFLSLHNDFANLFVNKEGYIYKYDNFSWIDFVLYSGSANKSAIITLKNGQETPVDISIKEIHLAHPIGEIKKMYSVKILSDSFHQISGLQKSEPSHSGSFTLDGLSNETPTQPEPIEIETKDSTQQTQTTLSQQTNSSLGSFTLSGLIEDDILNNSHAKKSIDNQNNFLDETPDTQNIEKETTQIDKNNNFILNLNEEELLSKDSQAPAIKDETKISEPTKVESEDFKLDFLKSDSSKEDENKERDNFIKEPEIEPQQAENNSLNNLLFKNEKEENSTQNSSEENSAFGFHLLKESEEDLSTKEDEKFIKSDEEEEENRSDVINLLKEESQLTDEQNLTTQPQEDDSKLSFLLNQDKQESEDTQATNETMPELSSQSLPLDESSSKKDIGFKLDFLKSDLIGEIKDENNIEVEKSEQIEQTQIDIKTPPLIEENFESQPEDIRKKSEAIIQQIKEDLKEIDSEYKKSNQFSDENTKNDIDIDNIADKSMDIQPKYRTKEEEDSILKEDIFSLNIKELENEHKESNEESNEHKRKLTNLDIQERKDINTNRTFTSTLNSLFSNLSTKKDEKVTDKNRDTDTSHSFALKKEKESIDISETKNSITESKEQLNNKQNSEFKISSLSSLGLNPDDEYDLLRDFISDAKESIETIEEFLKTEDFDKINYALVKIKSSAEILNLDAIIENSNSLRKHCITEDSQKVAEDTLKLKNSIEQLERDLEATAI